MTIVGVGFASSAEARATDCESTIERAKAEAMKGDYRSDLKLLDSVVEQLKPWLDTEDCGYLANYWSGFALWRKAINTANLDRETGHLEQVLRKAIDNFEASVEKRPDFADGHAAIAGTTGWLQGFAQIETNERTTLAMNAWKHIGIASQLQPENPRVLWVKAGMLLSAPPQYGGDRTQALKIFETVADRSKKPLSSLGPDWGVPEALMSLSWAHLNADAPNTATAEQYALRALELQPHWYYVREILLPQIRDKASSQSETESGKASNPT